MSEQQRWHRLFSLWWIDFTEGSAVTVQPEKDLSLKQQFLDVVLVRTGSGPLPQPLPDGFEELAAHNLVTFKSHQETLDGWALEELIGHYVNYRKQSSPSVDNLLPESDYRLFAVCVRFPHNLDQKVPLKRLRDGVYELRPVTQPLRVIVVHELPQKENNAMLLLFSAREELLRYGREHYRQHSPETSTLLSQLFSAYIEDPDMADKRLQEFYRETLDEILKGLPPEELTRRLSTEDRLKGLSSEERLEGLPVAERFKGLSPEEIAQALPLSPDAREALVRQLKANGSSSKPQ
jgi:hypothetical protein